MKKKVTGHMTAPKETFGSKLKHWKILPKLICLLMALFLWLLITDLQNSRGQGNDAPERNPIFMEQ
jgi:hypothetical protein